MLCALDGIEHSRKTYRLNAHHFDAGLQGLGRRGHAGYQPATADGHHQRVQIRNFLQHFQRHCALPGDDGFVIVGVHKGQLTLLGQCKRVCAGFFQRVSMQNDLGTKPACAVYLDAGREARHHDHRMQTQSLCVVRNALRMVARAHGNHALGRLLRLELGEPVAGPALLERRGELQVFKLQKNLCASDVGQCFRSHARGLQDVPLKALRSGKNVGKLNHGAIVRSFQRSCAEPIWCEILWARLPSCARLRYGEPVLH